MMICTESKPGLNLVINGPTVLSNPLSSTTYFFGQLMVNGFDTVGDRLRVYFPRSGVVKAVRFNLRQTAGTSTNASTLYLRINNTTDYLISNSILSNTSNLVTVYKNDLEIPVTDTDYFELKLVTPNWAATGTVPTAMTCGGGLFLL